MNARRSQPPVEGRGPVLGLVRSVDRRARRHVYGLGEWPRGQVAGELGSIWEEEPADGVPVWMTRDGRLVTPDHDAGHVPPSAGKTTKWIAGPATWRGLSPISRARSVMRRALEAPRASRWRATPDDDARAAMPAGYLRRDNGPHRLPLYSAIHPVTGDQLLTTRPDEAPAQGYGRGMLLGYLLAAAPVTGMLGTRVTPIPWAERFGEAFAHRPDLGRIELPAPGSAVDGRCFSVAGWALAGEGDESRVEIVVNGRVAGRARLGLPSLELIHRESASRRPAAPVAGFECTLTARDLPHDGDRLEIEAHVTTTAGAGFVLPLLGGVRPNRPTLHDGGQTPATARAGAATIAPRRNGSGGSGLRVLAFAHRLDRGGAQRYFFDQLLRLAADGCECTVVAPADDVWRGPLEAAGIEVHVVGGYPVKDRSEYEGKVAELVAWAGRRRFDVAFVNTIDCFIGADAAHRLELPVVWKIHESFDLANWWFNVHGSDPRHDHARSRAIEALGAADAVVFAADATRRLWEPQVRPERALTAPYGLELDPIDAYRTRFDPRAERARMQIPQDATVVLCLGTIEPRKGQVPLAQAFAKVAPAYPTARLALVGDLRTPYVGALRLYLARERLSSRFRIAPVTAEPYAWHALADVFALASDVESSPISILEAMAFATPVVATRVFGVPELITDGRDGYLCEPNDLDDLANALDRVLSADPEERRAVAVAGEERVRSRHEPTRYASNLRRLLEMLVEDPSAVPSWEATEPTVS